MGKPQEVTMGTLFEEPTITVVNRNNDIDKVHCHWFKYEKDSYEEPMSLFDGFNDLKVITYSYNYRFVAKLAEKFDTAQIILGAQFMATKMNEETANQLAEYLAQIGMVRKFISGNERLAKRIVDKEVQVRYPDGLVDHRKIYLLKADDGRTRVISGSANISSRAWLSLSQIENFEVSDDLYTYEMCLSEFETAWELCEPLMPTARVVNKVENAVIEELSDNNIDAPFDFIEDNPVIEKVRNCQVDTAIVLRETKDMTEKREILVFDNQINYFREHGSELLKNVKLSVDDGILRFVPKIIKKMEVNNKSIGLKKVDIVKKSADYPKLVIDYAKGEILEDDKVLDLNPPEEDVKNDIQELLQIFSFNSFIGKIRQAQENYFKLMVAMFSSPFNARLRCDSFLKDIDASALPLYLLLNSPANCGKTFMVEYFLKMMTGKKKVGYKFDRVNKPTLEAFQSEEKVLHKGIPIFIDEVNQTFRTSMGGLIRCVESCEQNYREFQPMTIYASNFVSDPDEALRKRMVFLTFDIGLPSDVDKQAFRQKGRGCLNRIGTAFYRKYLSYMYPYVVEELDKITTGEGLEPMYYPELMKKSSEIIIYMLQEYGFEVPDYMKVLSWNADFADSSKSVYNDELEKIYDLYKKENSLFTIDANNVIICLSNDKTGKKLVANWVNLLPREIEAEKIPDAKFEKIRMNRKELEKHLGVRFETSVLDKIKNFFSKG